MDFLSRQFVWQEEVVVGVAVGVSAKGRAALKGLILFILFGVGDGAVEMPTYSSCPARCGQKESRR